MKCVRKDGRPALRLVVGGCLEAKDIKRMNASFFLMVKGDSCDEQTGGPVFKSWGEEQIGRLLQRNGIRYQYEYPLAVVDAGKQRLYYPDFRLPDQGLIIEYFGVNGKKAYDEQTRHKIDVYRQAGIEGLFLTRDSLRGNWPGKILGQIDAVLKRRLEHFRKAYRR